MPPPYTFVADPELGEKVAARQIPCGCAQCDQKGGISMTGGASNNVGGLRCSNVYRIEYAG